MRHLRLLLALLIVASGSRAAASEEAVFPSREVHLIVPYAAGGGIDTATRGFARFLPEVLRTSVVVENWPGAGGRVAAARFQRQPNDGHWLYSDVLPSLSIGQLVYGGQYRFEEWVAVFGYSEDRSAVIVVKDSPFHTLHDLVQAARSRRLNIANPGFGLPIHLQSVVLKHAIGIDYTEVPFNGTAGAFAAVLGKNADFVIGNIQNYFQYENLRALAVVGDLRDPRLPDVPSTGELGYRVSVVPFTRGFWGPPGLKEDRRQVLERAFHAVMANPEFQSWAKAAGYELKMIPGPELHEAARQGHLLTEQFAHLLRQQ